MNRKISKIPKFRNAAEAAVFWDKHDSTEFLDELKPAHLDFPKPKHLLITLKPRQMDILRRLASKQGATSDTLVQKWIVEKLSGVTTN